MLNFCQGLHAGLEWWRATNNHWNSYKATRITELSRHTCYSPCHVCKEP